MTIVLRILLSVVFIFITQLEVATGQASWSKTYQNGLVVSAEEHASQVGREILEQGGNAVDAAVAVQFALAVTLPRAGNIGGGGFMVIHMKDGTTKALDFREQAPIRAYKDMYIKDGTYIPELSREGGLASGVPGVVDGMIKAIDRYGLLPLETVLEPAIKLARDGFSLSWKQASELNSYAHHFTKYEGSSKYFLKENEQPWKEGDLFIQTDLANTLKRIADSGREGFYSGQTADFIIEEMDKQGGIISYKDLQDYDSIWRDPIVAEFNSYKLHIMPPPSSGSIAIKQILEMLKGYDLKAAGFNSAEYIHLITETMRRAFADRAHYLGDPDFVDIPRKTLTDSDYNRQRMQNFSWDKATSSDDLGHGKVFTYKESSETTHYSIVDEDGNAVAVTTTLNGSFGSKVAVNGAGFMLNNEMDDFTAEPGEPNMFGLIQGEANAIEPGKRMLSSMTPTIVTKDGNVRMVLGAAGGPRIITATLHNFLNLAVFDMKPQQAISAPRFHHQWMPDKIYYEGDFGLNPDTKKLLEEKGHELQSRPTVGRAHVIYVDEDGLKFGSPDPRGDGEAMGY